MKTLLIALALLSAQANAYVVYHYEDGGYNEETNESGRTVSAECYYDDNSGELLGCN